jgi:hypothetical protein
MTDILAKTGRLSLGSSSEPCHRTEPSRKVSPDTPTCRYTLSSRPSQVIDAKHEPLEELSEKTWPFTNPHAPLLYYGLGIKHEDLAAGRSLMRFVNKHKLVKEDIDPHLRILKGVLRASTLLATQSGSNIHVTQPLGTDYTYVIAICRNWTAQKDWRGADNA